MHAGILGIHGFDRELLDPLDFDFILVRLFSVQKFPLEIRNILLFIHQPVLVLPELAFNHLFHHIDGYIHVSTDLFRTDELPLHRNRYFNPMFALVHAQRHICLGFRGEKFVEFPQLVLYGLTQPLSHIQIFPYDRKLHWRTSVFCFLQLLLLYTLPISKVHPLTRPPFCE